ncbi:hypothetical protein ABTZ59_32645 [Streptomyces sp. NPDC094034]|uniref:hypothetical protein n=1 Tax=Streptomyces sp. NPDC094034 TaxID=3155309 RepID=UPI0033266976
MPVGLILCEIGHSAAYGPLAVLLSEHFDTRTRYTGTSMGYQLQGAIVGLAPIAAASILTASGGAPNVGRVPVIIAVGSTVGLVALLLSPERSGMELPH